jgi:hypothetical protein
MQTTTMRATALRAKQPSQTRRWNLTKVNLWFDLAIFVAALVAPAMRLTGLLIHEWLGIVLGIAIIGHLLLHWQWIVGVTRRFFGKTTWSARINYILNSVFFVAMTLIIFSGIMISKVALPQLGIQLSSDMNWRMLHTLAGDVMVFVLAAHVALHWKWILNTTNRYMLQPWWRPLRRAVRTQQPAQIEEEGVA